MPSACLRRQRSFYPERALCLRSASNASASHAFGPEAAASLTSVHSRALTGARRSSLAASATTAPLIQSTSGKRPAARSSAMEERAVGSIFSMRPAMIRNRASGRLRTGGSQAGGSGVRRAGWRRPQRPAAKVLPAGQSPDKGESPHPELFTQGQAGERVDCVVEVHQQLRPLHRFHIAAQVERQSRGPEERYGRGRHRVVLDGNAPFRCTMQMSRSGCRHVERNHAAQDFGRRQKLLQDRCVAHPF